MPLSTFKVFWSALFHFFTQFLIYVFSITKNRQTRKIHYLLCLSQTK
uniref:Uncharacterized protein n=1 Tax=Lepeophtheirus salmonis TaxID=72036 RepID=A0A0K2TGF3_LEPSM